jgi:trehalose synthase
MATIALRSALLLPLLFSLGCPAGREGLPVEEDYLRWLRERSMLEGGRALARSIAGSGRLWRHAFALPRPRAAAALAPVWFTAYPASTVTRPGRSVLATLADPELWRAFREIGIRGVHTGPMKRSGGVVGRRYTKTVDGHFDRIGHEIDPAFGTDAEFQALARSALARGAVIIDDIIPGHTGKGPDFRLAERAFADYPGIFHMVEIRREDWGLLPPVPAGKDSVNLRPAAVDRLRAKGYIVGARERVIFFEPGVKESDWSATSVVPGADGRERRWVYLHYFKDGQPSLNWLDPSFAAQRLVIGDALHSMLRLGTRGLRLDANGFLGIEPREGGAYSEGHPLSITSNALIGGVVRKLGGFTFQELNLTLEDIRELSRSGADLSYDFVTRPAYHHAAVTGDARFLRLMLKLMHATGIDPAGLIHALQNHDELTLELVHFWTAHAKERFALGDESLLGGALRDRIRAELHTALLAPRAPYNLKASNGVSCTSASLCAAALGIRDLGALGATERAAIQKLHLLLVLYNAFQPGVFALSGWDLVGALTLPKTAVQTLLADGDTRWINRGAYDLLGADPRATRSAAGLPVARALYGPLPSQLRDPASFASQLRHLLALRAQLRIQEAQQLEVPETRARGLLLMVHRLPSGALEVTALNFGATPVKETVPLRSASAGSLRDARTGRAAGSIGGDGIPIELGSHEGAILLVQ